MGKLKNGGQEEEFLRSAWTVIRETEKSHDVSVDLELVPQQQTGVFLIYLIATDMMSGSGFYRPIARERRAFPNANNGTLAGAIFAATLQLDALVTDFRAHQHERPWTTGG